MGNQSLANKYRPKDFSEVYGQGMTVEIVRKMCEAEQLSNRNFLFTGPAGTGKAQPLYSKVLTPNGFITMGEVTVGQEIITGSGAIAKVSGVFPQGVKKVYEITLQDRTKIRVAEDHLNVFYRYNQNRKCRQDYCKTTLELMELMNRRYRLRMDIPKIDIFNTDSFELPINPYLLGVFIGDGSLSNSNSVHFSNSESDVIAKVDSLLHQEWNTYLHKLPGDNYDYSIGTVGYSEYKYTFIFEENIYNGVPAIRNKLISLGYPCFDGETIVRICDNTATNTLKQFPELQGKITYTVNSLYKHGGECTKFADALTSLGMREKSINKHIPKEYLLSSRENRLLLLQGLFDTDGYIGSGGAVEFTTSSKQLSEDFAFLVRSLGIRDTVCTKEPKYIHNGEKRVGHTAYRHCLKIPNGLPFYTSEKHSARYKDRQQPPLRNIVSIDYIGEEECQCIYVDHPDHTYISDDFIVTHNTTIGRIIAKTLNGTLNNTIEVDAASNSGVDDVRDLVQQATQYPIGTKYKIFMVDECHSLSNTAWQALLKCLEEQVGSTIWVFCLDGEGLVYTNKGLVPLKQITVGTKVWDGSQYRDVLNIFDNGQKDSLEITMANGNQFVCTPNHMISVLQGDQLVWKRADELTVDDYILDYFNYTRNNIHSVCSLEESWFLGYLTGNGNYTDHSMNLYTPFKKWDKVKSCLDALVEQHIIEDYIDSSDKRAVARNVYDTRIHFKSDKYHPRMREWYEKVKLNPNYTRGTKSIPKIMFTESADNIRAFIDGWYYADGNGMYESFFDTSKKISDGKWTSVPSIKCSNHNMISDLQQLLKLLGLHASVRYSTSVVTEENRSDKTYISPGTYHTWDIYLLRKYGYIKNPQFKDILIHKYESMSVGKYKLDLNNLKRCSDRNISPQMMTEAGYDYSGKGRFFKIQSIESVGYRHVYDIEVEGSHQFVYNGILVHNCTTNPEKIPSTIISRVQTFKLSKISTENITKRLKFIMDSEIKEGRELTYDMEALSYISRLANGGMRDSITMLDKCLAFGNNVNSELITKALDLPDYDDYFNLLNALVRKDNTEITAVIDRVYNSGTNFIKWFEGFHSFLCNIVKYVFLKDISRTMIPYHYQDKIQKYNAQHAFVCLKLSNLVMTMNKELKATQYQTETAMTYLCVPVVPKKEG